MSTFKSGPEKKSTALKDFSFEKNIIASEIGLNPCVSLKSLCEKLIHNNVSGSYSVPTVSRIIKNMNYSRKTLTLVPINRNSNSNKDVRAQYEEAFYNIRDDQLIFLDETGFNLHSYQRMGYSAIDTKCFINVLNSKGTNISVLCAINKTGIVGYQIKSGTF
ncbi:hypothetical protein DMUE_0770 [Dictyocoela muelleri]|nr:hypothetical protein DMUE_0770 [Dictyocoela muelleri]